MLKKLDSHRKYVLAVFLIFAVIVFLGAITLKNHNKKIYAGTKTENGVSTVYYPGGKSGISFSNMGNSSQPINLNEGLAKFDINYRGKSIISVYILNEDGDPVASVADTWGPFVRTKMVYVPQTGQYILKVKCEGQWSVSEK